MQRYTSGLCVILSHYYLHIANIIYDYLFVYFGAAVLGNFREFFPPHEDSGIRKILFVFFSESVIS